MCGCKKFKPSRKAKMNPYDDEIRRLERAAAEGDALAAQRLTILRARTGEVSPLAAARIPGEHNLTIYRDSKSKVSVFFTNPLGGGGGGNHYRSIKAAITAELKRYGQGWNLARFPRVFVIEARFDSSYHGGEWMPEKTYWVDMQPYASAPPRPPTRDELWDMQTR
jgi:hypothetical protein